MTPPYPDAERLRAIKSFPMLVKYLRDDLDWPIEQESFDELTFEYEPDELGLDAKTSVKVKEIRQLRPLASGQPWGIFFLNFEPKRLPVVVLRRILQSLVLKKRSSAGKAHQAAWRLNDLLFISSYGESDHRDLSFAHFAEDEDTGGLPTLKVLGWDDEDTVLCLAHTHETLRNKLRWPENEKDLEEWRKRWSSAFTLGHRQVIKTSNDLSVALAHLATAIRKRVNRVLAVEAERGPLRTLMAGFREALIHDLSEDDFADTYAQTITYGLLAGRIERPKVYDTGSLTALPVTNPFLRDLLSQFMRVGKGRESINFDELGIGEVTETLKHANMEAVLRDFGDKNPQEDPVIIFYELFLKEYDPKKRTSRGVFYTPRPVVSYIVRSVHELLQTEFGLEDGLADTTTWGEMQKRFKDLKLPPHAKPEDPFVRILDIATGTGTFFVETIEVIHRTMVEKWKKEGHYEKAIQKKWNEYVPDHLLPRLFGFELMMAPYAIAHMKVGLKLHETGYDFSSDERARIYLTNSLEPPGKVPQQMLFESNAIAHEAQAVAAVKKEVPFTVVMGNPPYANYGMLNKSPFIQNLLEDYKRGLNEKKLNLDDDYLKFFCFGQYLLRQSLYGCLAMITNSSYIDGLVHRRMRESLLHQFGVRHVVDLHGNSRRQEKNPDGTCDENVFDIQQGVAISLFLAPCIGQKRPLKYAAIWGTREKKYRDLSLSSASTTVFQAHEPAPAILLFTPEDSSNRAEYDAWLPLSEVFAIAGSGLNTDRDELCIDFEIPPLENRMKRVFSGEMDEDFRRTYNFYPSSSYDPVSLAKRQAFDSRAIRTCIYRPFDFRNIYYKVGFTSRPVFDVQGHMLHPNLGLLLCRQSKEPFAVLASRQINTHKIVAVYDRTSLTPLWIYRQESSHETIMPHQGARHSNLTPDFCRNLATRMGVVVDAHGLPHGFTAEEIYSYIYAAFYSQTYRSRYSAFLKNDFPRIPLTSHLPLFRTLAVLGSELVALHLVEFRLEDERPKDAAAKDWPVYPRLTEFVGKVPSGEIEKVSYARKTVWLDKAQRVGFRGIPEEVFEFHIGGYQVCQKWLKDRKGRRLTADDILHYHKIVTALSNTIRLMKEIDTVIDKHGGWPGAFNGAET